MINQSSSLRLLRVSLGVVFIWFGALKVFGASPIVPLIKSIYPSFPYPLAVLAIGIVEILIGLGFLSGKMIKATTVLMWLQMAGIFAGLVIAPHLFFNNSNPILLTTDGEFVIKNLVILAASLVVLTHRD